MTDNEGTLQCTSNLEWLNKEGVIQKKLQFKISYLRILRNEFREMFVEISASKCMPVKLQLKGISVHKKFMHEGKASIKFQDVNCTLFLSNAPPAQLMGFLRMIFVKMTGEKVVPTEKVSLRTKLLSSKPKSIEDISPVTIADLENARKKVSKSTTTTPSPLSRKRKLQVSNETHPAKKLYSISSFNESLNVGQKEVFDSCLAGHNTFFTGSAGTGKSYLLRKIIAALPPDVTFATASTGVAACHIGGTTIHQFAGIGDGEASLKRSIELASRPGTAVIWRKCKHLVIDEISMVDATYFEKIEAVAREVRKNDKPFGGIQLILCGDFLQLPPIPRNTKENNNRNSARFCFQTPVWGKCIQRYFELTQVHRQSDNAFINILNSIRLGKVPEDIVNKLNATSKQKIEQNGILATRLCTHKSDVNVINESKLNDLPGETKTFEAQDSDRFLSKQLDLQTPVPNRLVLKVGAQVMLLKNINISLGLVNGARGVVTGFKDNLPIVRFKYKEYVTKHERWIIKTAAGVSAVRMQVPLKLAWAFSIHKSQGLTLDCVEMSLTRVFEAGQAYVALSRAQSLESLRVLDFKASQVWAHPDVLEFYRKLRRQLDEIKLIPLGKRETKPQKKRSLPVNKKLFSSVPLMTIN